MKKIVLISIVCAFLFGSLKAQIKLGISGGLDYASMNVKFQYLSDFGIKGIPAYHFGLTTVHPIKENLFITADLLFSKKGFIQSISQHYAHPWSGFSDSLTEFKVPLYYIELPILMEFKVKFEKINIFFGFGPYIEYGIDGKVTLNIQSTMKAPGYTHSTSLNYSENVHWNKYPFNSNNFGKIIVDDYGYTKIRRFDYGSTVRFGIGFSSFILNAECKYGFANLMWTYRKYEKMNNRSLGLSLVYFFHSKKQ
jgi:hypothetical protein